MPSVDLLIKSPIKSSFRVEQVCGMFDIPNNETVSHEWKVNLPIEDKPWQIGLIAGPSGSGKTTLGKNLFKKALFHEGYTWPTTGAVVDGFPKDCNATEITKALSSVGFSSPPHWLKRFSHLSNGQKFRCELARVLLEDAETVVFDEWTSVVDRDAAQVASAAVSKALRKRKTPKLVALSCHYDVVDWLQPDWVYNVATNEFHWRLLRQRPAIELEIFQVGVDAWKAFRGHHYLTAEIHRAAKCFVATWRNQPVAFTSFLTFPHPTKKHTKREHRTVVLPDYQGVGIGNAVSEWLGSLMKAGGYNFISTTSHPAMIRHRQKSPAWKVHRFGHVSEVSGPESELGNRNTGSKSRVTAGCEFIGEAAKHLQEHAKTLLVPNREQDFSTVEGHATTSTKAREPKGLKRSKRLTGRNRKRPQNRR